MKTIDPSEAEQLDGHDKLYKIGFPIWAIVDDATSKWLGAWVVPSNRMGNVIAYLWLCAVQKYGGKRIFVFFFFFFELGLLSERAKPYVGLYICN